MNALRKAFPTDSLVVWSAHDYSHPDTKCIDHFVDGEQVEVLERNFPGVLVRWADGRTGWVCDWNVE